MHSIPNTWRILILLFLIPLTLTWLLSLRPVRLKIGDYYYNQGNFDQAVNWYERLLREHGFKGAENRIDRLKYEEDLSKLKLALHRQMEERLLKVSQFLGFGQNKDLKSLLKDPKLFPKDIQVSPGTKPKEELQNFDNISNNFKRLFGENTDSRELDNFISMGYFFKGIIDEAENNFILADSIYEKAAVSYRVMSRQFIERRKNILLNVADEHFSRSPLNWVKARDLFESYIKNGNLNNADTLIKLGYIYAKSNNFNISYDFFKRAYQLLVDADLDLKQITNYFKRKRTFLYPDDLKLIPQKLTKQYPFLQDISFFEVRSLMNLLEIQVSAISNGFIGKTGIKSPVDIIIRSAGHLVGSYGEILINGNNFSQNKRGYNIVILNPGSGEVEKSENFETYGSNEDVKKMVQFIDGIKSGKIVCVAVANEASLKLSKEDGNIFSKIGAKENLYGKFLWGHAIIGVKGAKYGEAIEALSDKPIEIYVTPHR